MATQPKLHLRKDQSRPDGVCRGESGAALLVTVLILLVVSILGATVINLGNVDYRLSANYRSNIAALNLADSGLQAAAADLRADYYADPTDNWLLDWVDMRTRPPSPATPFPDANGTQVNGLTLTAATFAPNPYVGTPYSLGGPSGLGNGTFTRTIWLPPVVTLDNGKPVVNIRVRSVGIDPTGSTLGDAARATLDGIVSIDLTDSSPYSAGAFLGAGDFGDLIRGGPVHIAGSVVAIGDVRRGRGFFGLGRTRLNLSNGSSIANNYAGIENTVNGLGALYDKLPALDTMDLNGETVQDLRASVHVKDATIWVGRGALGEIDNPGDGHKETLDGIYTDAPFTLRFGEVHADTITASDLGDDLEFPGLSAPYIDPYSGASYARFSDYLNAHSFKPVTGGDVVISSETGDFNWVDPFGNGSLRWDAANAVLTVDGIVKISGRVRFGDPAAPGGDTLAAVQYEGTGVLWATDDIEISKDLYPVGDYMQDGPDLDTLIDGNLGLVSSDEIVIDSGSAGSRGRGRRRGPGRGNGGAGGDGDSNLQILATLFAENRIEANTRANVAGSIVTNAINVARSARLNIWHVPSLAGNSPTGMPVGLMLTDIEVAVREWFQRR